jgi:hypothetical protein
MGGIFGGFLQATNAVGGIVLHVLIGSPAWRNSDIARGFRLLFGGFAAGLIPATVLSFPIALLLPMLTLTDLFFSVLGLTVLAVFLLEGIRYCVDGS